MTGGLLLMAGLCLLAALEGDPGQLGDAFDELGDLGPELRPELVQVGGRVLDDVVEQRRGDRLLVQVQLGADLRHAPRVVDELLARAPHLATVRALYQLGVRRFGMSHGAVTKVLAELEQHPERFPELNAD